MSIRVYLAGPEVFLPDADALFGRKKALCARYGVIGVSPLDNLPNVPECGAMRRPWHVIYHRNELHLRNCDALIANLTPFRGISADPGTVFELGFMRGLGRAVFGYSMTGIPFTERTMRAVGAAGRSAGVDGDGLAIENFGLRDNLMIDGAIDAAGGVFVARDHGNADPWRDLSLFEDCVRAASA